ncbi:DUF998 domain-containing protein [Leucobacter sp. M11]|uniref:DUF998 domain-containing protein n=1 Tax=Leucobacter sp. M11 TaxID=2993565 RepID=UPI002D80444F|nr:DUF998 domain-containing protein [Leucobacter sp. M11]MEB4613704.1 DUF998 domain-containing protein [Leucobacter sp. M11]
MYADWRKTTSLILLLAAAVTYAGVPWEALVGFPLDPARSYLSELAAVDQPTSPLFRMLDGLTGALILCALFLGRQKPRVRGTRSASAFTFAAFACLTLLDAASPMACATSASAQCAAADAANTLGTTHQVHTLSSSAALIAVLLSAILLAISVTRDRAPARLLERWLVLGGVGALTAVTIIVSVLAVRSMADGQLLDGGGYAQRAQVLLVSAYIAGFGIISARSRTHLLGTSPATIRNAS